MDVPALLAHALSAVNGNQAELARRLGRSETTVSRWVTGRNGIDYESALRIARLTGLPARDVIESAGLDPDLLPEGLGYTRQRQLTPLEADIQQRTGRIQAAVDATEGLPDDFVDVYLRKVLDNTEDEITATIQMVRQLRRAQGARIELSVEAAPDLSDAIEAENSDSTGLGDELNGCKVLPRRVLLVSR